MSKILTFSSTHEESFIDATINKIKKDLNKPGLSKTKLHHVQKELDQLNHFLNENLRQQASLTQSAFTLFLKTQLEISSLAYDCQNLFINKCVDQLTEKAQKLAKDGLGNCKDISRRVIKLKKEILDLTHKEALSLENRQMIHLANHYLSAKDAIDFSKDVSALRLTLREENAKKDLNDLFDISIDLYEIAGSFYNCDIQGALEQFYSLSPTTQQEIKKRLQELGIDLHKIACQSDLALLKKQLYLIIQTCLGYSHYILYASFDYPSFAAIDELFQDLERTLKESVS
ncbi:MAG: hypothetical protein FJZ63_07140 [Chlamydiae bacterium]|nr:hypothetical protein [Chlamydiota bacterium]